jgi:hypothetical protein
MLAKLSGELPPGGYPLAWSTSHADQYDKQARSARRGRWTMSEPNPKTTSSSTHPDQQPIQRTIGKRVTPPPGTLPTREARAAMASNARYLTRAPKGIFFYKNHEEMIRDRDRWTIDAVIARHTERA